MSPGGSAAACALQAAILIALGFPRLRGRLLPPHAGGAAAVLGVAAAAAATGVVLAEGTGPLRLGLILGSTVAAAALALQARGPCDRPAAGAGLLALLVALEVVLGQGSPGAAGGGHAAGLSGGLLAATLAVLAIGSRLPPTGTGYTWRLSLEDAGAALVALTAYALPSALLAWTLGGSPGQAGAPVDRTPWPGYWGWGGAALAALAWEIVHRGFAFTLLQRWIVSRQGPGPALVLSALLGAGAASIVSGRGSLLALALAAWMGVCAGWALLRTGSVLPAVALHLASAILDPRVLPTS